MAFPNLVRPASIGTVTATGTGTAWTGASYINDSTWHSNYAQCNLGASGQSKDLDLQDLDVSWFDTNAHNMVGLSVIVLASFSTANLTLHLDILDATGTVISAEETYSPGAMSFHMASIDLSADISAAMMADADFGLRLWATTSASGAGNIGIMEVLIVPRFERKILGSDQAVIEIKDAGGNDQIPPSGALVRWIDDDSQLGGWTGTISFPDFNDQSGVFFIVSHMEKMTHSSPYQIARSAAWTGNGGIGGHGMEIPDINWNNSTKEFTVSTGGAYPLPSGFETWAQSCGFTIVGVHYK